MEIFARLKKKQIYTKLILSFIFIITNIFFLINHNPWRDELEALGLVKNASNLSSLIEFAWSEGHGFVYYFLLKGLNFLITNLGIIDQAYSLKLLNFITFLILIFLFNKLKYITPIILFLVFTSHYIFWEYSVITRSYVLLLPLMLIYITSNNLKLKLISLGLLANIEIYGLIFSVLFFFEFIFKFRKKITKTLIIFLIISICLIFMAVIGYIYSYIQIPIFKIDERFLKVTDFHYEIFKILKNLIEVILPITENYFIKLNYGWNLSSLKPSSSDVINANPLLALDVWMKGDPSFKLFDLCKLLIILYFVTLFLTYDKNLRHYMLTVKIKAIGLNHTNLCFLLVFLSCILFLYLFPDVHQFRHIGFFYLILISFVVYKLKMNDFSILNNRIIFILLLLNSLNFLFNYKVYFTPLSDSFNVAKKLEKIKLENNKKNIETIIYGYPFFIAQNYSILKNLDIKVFECDSCLIGAVKAVNKIVIKKDGTSKVAKKINVHKLFKSIPNQIKFSKNNKKEYYIAISDLYRGNAKNDDSRLQTDALLKDANNQKDNKLEIIDFYDKGIVIDEHTVILKLKSDKIAN